jgi:hypothetical protein
MTDTEMLCILLLGRTLDEVAEGILMEDTENGRERVHTA